MIKINVDQSVADKHREFQKKTTKTCNRCGVTKTLDRFPKTGAVCRTCKNHDRYVRRMKGDHKRDVIKALEEWEPVKLYIEIYGRTNAYMDRIRKNCIDNPNEFIRWVTEQLEQTQQNSEHIQRLVDDATIANANAVATKVKESMQRAAALRQLIEEKEQLLARSAALEAAYGSNGGKWTGQEQEDEYYRIADRIADLESKTIYLESEE